MTTATERTERDEWVTKDEVLAALGRSGDQMARTLRAAHDGTRPIPGMVWTVADLAIHLVTTLQELTHALHGEASAYDGANVAATTAAVDNRLVAGFPVRDLPTLAQLFDIERARFAAAIDALDADEPVPAIAPHATPLAIGAIFVVDHHNHGMQLAAARVHPWRFDVDDVRLCVGAVAPATYDRAAAARMNWRFALHLRGAPPLGLTVAHGTLGVGEVTGPVDCHVLADPSPFLLQSAGGFVSRLHLLLHLELLAYGRRVWGMLALPKLLPAVEHGGKQLGPFGLLRQQAATRRDAGMRAAALSAPPRVVAVPDLAPAAVDEPAPSPAPPVPRV